MKHVILWAVVVLCACGGLPAPSHAQESCGSILEHWDDGEGNITTDVTPIEDCANPFNLAVPNADLTVSFNETPVNEGGSYPFVGTTAEFTLEGLHPEANYVTTSLYKTVPEGYERIPMDDYGRYTFATPGTYTVVVDEMLLIVTQNVLQKLFSFIIPTAYAFPGVSSVITFTVTEAVEEPQGISNILFLPGIQASRLYTKINGEEERLWEPFGDDDVELLRMTETGGSINDVYTKDVVDEKGGVAIGGNIYKGFLEYLYNIDGPFAGPVVETFPYDWRHDVSDIVEHGTVVENGVVKKPIETLTFLATTSPTKKVTLIAHSNGGLLAKAIVLKLAEEGKANLIDKIIFIASPHIGTPKGLAALLHGYDQELISGLVATDERVRDVMKNMPGVYGLLPSGAYIDSLSEPLISFDDSSTTKMFRDAYGFTLSNMDEYTRFLVGDEGREDPGDSINKPSIANASMLTQALDEHRTKLDNWSAPAGVEALNIVGTGLPTAKSIEYQEFDEVHCYGGGPVVSCTQPTTKIEAVIHFTRYGDETVVSKSANFPNSTRYYIDLFSIGEFIHANITESETTQTLVDHILHGSSTDEIDFVSTTEPTFSDADLDVHRIHSPAHIYLRDDSGNITGTTEVGGEWNSEIPGSDYFEAGGVKYVLVPSDRVYTVVIEGEDNGIYTHSMSVLADEVETTHHSYTATVTPISVMQYAKDNNGEFSTITIDEDGDGVIDKEMTLTGEIIEKEVTYDDLANAIRGLSLPKKIERLLLVQVKQAEKLSNRHVKKGKNVHAEDVLLRLIEAQLKWYTKIGLITEVQFREVEDIIDKLIEK